MTMSPDNLYVRTFPNGTRGEELMAVNLDRSRLLRIRLLDNPLLSEGLDKSSSGGWEQSSADRISNLKGDFREATDADISRFFLHWRGNGSALSQMRLRDERSCFGLDMEARITELWSQRIDQYVKEGREIPYGYKHVGYNYFRHRPYLWKMLAVAVLQKSTAVNGNSPAVAPWMEKPYLAWATEDRDTPFALEGNTDRWCLEVGEEFFSKKQIDDIIGLASTPVANAMGDLRAVQGMRLRSGDRKMAPVMKAQKDLLERMLVTQLYDIIDGLVTGE